MAPNGIRAYPVKNLAGEEFGPPRASGFNQKTLRAVQLLKTITKLTGGQTIDVVNPGTRAVVKLELRPIDAQGFLEPFLCRFAGITLP